MRPSRSFTTALATAAALALAVSLSAASSASAVDLDPTTAVIHPAEAAELDARGITVHCVAQVVGVDAGVFVTEDSCFATAADADAFVSSLAPPDLGGATAPDGIAGPTTESGSNTIGWHFTGTSYTGSNIRIVGTTCSGGVWPASGIWNNNIESSVHYCGSEATRFWDYSYCSGPSAVIGGSVGSFGWFNNRTSCVQYGY